MEKNIPIIANDRVSLSGSKLVCKSILANITSKLTHEQIINPMKNSLRIKILLERK